MFHFTCFSMTIVFCIDLSQLAVLAAAAVVAADRFDSFVFFRLALDAQADTRNRFPAGLRNPGVTQFAEFEAVTLGQAIACTTDCILYCCVDLILHRAVFCEATRHWPVTRYPRVDQFTE